MNAQKLFQKIQTIKVPRLYSSNMQELDGIYSLSPGHFDGLYNAFRYGFLKGQRYAGKYTCKPHLAPTQNK